MISMLIRRALALMLSLCILAATVAAATPELCRERAYDGYIVKLRDGVSLRGVTEDASGLITVQTLPQARAFPSELVEYIEPNYLVELFSETAPNDPYYADYQWNLQVIHGYEAQLRGLTGRGVKVGFVDSGINLAHEDLDAGRIQGANFHSDGLEYHEDTYGHGTFSAGILAAQTNNGIGLAGLAPEVELYAYRIFSGKTTQTSAVVAAIEQAVADGCQVINLSLGTPNSSISLRQAVEKAVASGAVVVAAVGNGGSAVTQYPAAYPGVIGVGSVDSALELSDFSQRNASVDFTAPGDGVPSLDNLTPDGYKLNITSDANRGTSFSAPVVTAMAALALGYEARITPDDLFALLQKTALDRGDVGYDTSYGHGVVDVAAFVQELCREYDIVYELGGGQLPEGAVSIYSVRCETITLPIPTREGHWFTGWYTEEGCSGTPVTEIPAGSLGDRVFYAGWRSHEAAAVASVQVKGCAAERTQDGNFQVLFPYGTDLGAIASEQIVIVPADPSSAVSVPRQSTAEPNLWEFSVTTAAPAYSRAYTIRLACQDTSTVVTEHPDGSKTTTVTDHSTGVITGTTERADGVRVKTVTAPGAAPTVSITLPEGMTRTVVEVPLEHLTPGSVPVDTVTGEPVVYSLAAEGVLYLAAEGSRELVLVDRARSFADVSEGQWFAPYVDFVSSRGLFQGMTESDFCPAHTMNRAMAVTILYRMEGCPPVEPGQSFTDVPEGSWYAPAVAWAVAQGITKGVGGGQFAPGDLVTREQLAAFLFRYAKGAGFDVSQRVDFDTFADSETVHGWAREAISWAVAVEILNGFAIADAFLLTPLAPANRAEAAAMLSRFVQYTLHAVS